MAGNGFFKDPNLIPIQEKVLARERLTFEDGLALYRSTDLLSVGYLANIVRERRHGNKAYYIINQHINYSNICINGCKFCAFGKEAGDPQAYEMSLEEIFGKVEERLADPITEIHIVGGLHPELPFSYYLEMLRGIKNLRPDGAFAGVYGRGDLSSGRDCRFERGRDFVGPAGSRPGLTARRGSRSFQPPHPPESLCQKAFPGGLAAGLPDRPPAGLEHQCHHALRASGDPGRTGEPSDQAAGGPG